MPGINLTTEIPLTAEPFGNGSDGDVVILEDTVLYRDWNFRNLTIQNNASLYTQGMKVFVSETLTIESGSKIHNNGPAGGNASGVVPGGGGLNNTMVYADFPRGGQGGDGGYPTGSGTGLGTSAAVVAPHIDPAVYTAHYFWMTGGGGTGGAGGGAGVGTLIGLANVPQFYCFAQGGRGGAAVGTVAGALAGGGGGGGGGILFIFAKRVLNDGAIEANGGAGGNGITFGTNKSGNGGGGGGGCVLLIYNILEENTIGTVTATGGAAGTGGNGGNAGSNGVTQSLGYVTY